MRGTHLPLIRKGKTIVLNQIGVGVNVLFCCLSFLVVSVCRQGAQSLAQNHPPSCVHSAFPRVASKLAPAICHSSLLTPLCLQCAIVRALEECVCVFSACVFALVLMQTCLCLIQPKCLRKPCMSYIIKARIFDVVHMFHQNFQPLLEQLSQAKGRNELVLKP